MSVVRIVGGGRFPAVAVVLDAIGDLITAAGVGVVDDGGSPGFPSAPGGGSLSTPFVRIVGGGRYATAINDSGDTYERILAGSAVVTETGATESAPVSTFVPRVYYY